MENVDITAMAVDGYCHVQSVATKGGKKTILRPMKLDFPVNSVTAILGPSGSGATLCSSCLLAS